MNEWNEHEREELAVVDNALRTYPLAPVPPTLAPAVMGRIANRAPMPRFHLQWMDYALGLLAVAMVGLGLLLWQGLFPNSLLDLIQSSVMPFDLQTTVLWLGSLLAGLVLLAGCVAVAALVFK